MSGNNWRNIAGFSCFIFYKKPSLYFTMNQKDHFIFLHWNRFISSGFEIFIDNKQCVSCTFSCKSLYLHINGALYKILCYLPFAIAAALRYNRSTLFSPQVLRAVLYLVLGQYESSSSFPDLQLVNSELVVPVLWLPNGFGNMSVDLSQHGEHWSSPGGWIIPKGIIKLKMFCWFLRWR